MRAASEDRSSTDSAGSDAGPPGRIRRRPALTMSPRERACSESDPGDRELGSTAGGGIKAVPVKDLLVLGIKCLAKRREKKCMLGPVFQAH